VERAATYYRSLVLAQGKSTTGEGWESRMENFLVQSKKSRQTLKGGEKREREGRKKAIVQKRKNVYFSDRGTREGKPAAEAEGGSPGGISLKKRRKIGFEREKALNHSQKGKLYRKAPIGGESTLLRGELVEKILRRDKEATILQASDVIFYHAERTFYKGSGNRGKPSQSLKKSLVATDQKRRNHAPFQKGRDLRALFVGKKILGGRGSPGCTPLRDYSVAKKGEQTSARRSTEIGKKRITGGQSLVGPQWGIPLQKKGDCHGPRRTRSGKAKGLGTFRQ